jgi:lyso-ornithine lipid O-acyltransferase
MTGFLRMCWRLIFFGVYTTRIVAEIALRNQLQGADIQRSMRIRRRWAGRLLRGVGVHITVSGAPPTQPCLIVCNHVSYIDPFLILRDVDAWPVAKAEMANWPVIGKGAQMAGILYLKREDKTDRTAMIGKMSAALQQGFPILIFPEGTTSNLMSDTLPFKKGSFLMAERNAFPVLPVALQFEDPEDAWVAQESFLTHAIRRFRRPRVRVRVHYGTILPPGDAEYLCSTSRNWIREALQA